MPEHNLIIKYSLLQNRVIMRIGGDDSSTFNYPVSISEHNGYLYVCNKNSKKINRIDLRTFLVEDYKEFDEEIYNYVRVADNEFVILGSGVYLL